MGFLGMAVYLDRRPFLADDRRRFLRWLVFPAVGSGRVEWQLSGSSPVSGNPGNPAAGIRFGCSRLGRHCSDCPESLGRKLQNRENLGRGFCRFDCFCLYHGSVLPVGLHADGSGLASSGNWHGWKRCHSAAFNRLCVFYFTRQSVSGPEMRLQPPGFYNFLRLHTISQIPCSCPLLKGDGERNRRNLCVFLCLSTTEKFERPGYKCYVHHAK